MLKAEDQIDWAVMYMYQTDIFTDLHSAIDAFLIGYEYEGRKAECKEVSMDTVDDVEAWKKKRKELLLADFAGCLNELTE